MKLHRVFICLAYSAIIAGCEGSQEVPLQVILDYSELSRVAVGCIADGDMACLEDAAVDLLNFFKDEGLKYNLPFDRLQDTFERILPLVEYRSSDEFKKNFGEAKNDLLNECKKAKDPLRYLLQAIELASKQKYKEALIKTQDGLKDVDTFGSEKNKEILHAIIDYRGRVKEKLKDYSGAYADYEKEGDITGMLSLILTGRWQVTEDRKNHLLNVVKQGALNNPNSLFAFMYCLLQITEGNVEEGVARLRLFNQGSLMRAPLAKFQLGMAYYYGIGVDQDQKKAEDYFVSAEASLTLSGRVAQGYRIFYGIGKEKDEKKALSYFSDRTVFDDLPLPFELLFPDIAKAMSEKAEEERKQAAALLLAEEEKAEQGKKKKKPRKIKKREQKEAREKPQPQASSSISSGESHRELLPQEIAKPIDWKNILGTPDIWNNWFPVTDGSRVIAIDYNEKTITIYDQKRDEKLLFYVKHDPNEKRRSIPQFNYHQRILLRQDLSQSDVNEKMAYNHSFAQMLDYVIQQFGILAPLLKASGRIDDQLVADVVRIDAQGNKKLCHAEYTFGKKGKEVYVYHRLLRPVKDEKSPLSSAVPSSSKSALLIPINEENR